MCKGKFFQSKKGLTCLKKLSSDGQEDIRKIWNANHERCQIISSYFCQILIYLKLSGLLTEISPATYLAV